MDCYTEPLYTILPLDIELDTEFHIDLCEHERKHQRREIPWDDERIPPYRTIEKVINHNIQERIIREIPPPSWTAPNIYTSTVHILNPSLNRVSLPPRTKLEKKLDDLILYNKPGVVSQFCVKRLLLTYECWISKKEYTTWITNLSDSKNLTITKLFI